MSTARRRLVRPAIESTASDSGRHHQLQKLRNRLEQERKGLARWLTRLKRAFHSFEKIQQRIARVERQIANLED